MPSKDLIENFPQADQMKKEKNNGIY